MGWPRLRNRSDTPTPCVSRPPGFDAEVEDERSHAGLGQRVDRTCDLLLGRVAEDIQVHVADAVRQQDGAADGAAVDLLPNERDRPAGARPLGDDRDGRPRNAAQRGARLLHRPACGGLAGHLDDPIAGLNAGALGRRSREGRHHDDPAIPDIDLDADAAVIAGRALVQPRESLGPEVRPSAGRAAHRASRRWPSHRGRTCSPSPRRSARCAS